MPLPFYDESKTVNLPPRNLNPTKLKIANKIFDELISDGFAFESPKFNEFSSPICLVIYPDQRKPRLTGDFSGVDGVNALTKPLQADLPRITDIHQFMSKARFIATLDLPKAFWQILLKPEDQLKTTLAIPGRKICFKRTAFGLKNVPAYFQNTMNEIFSMSNVYIYIDDIIVIDSDFNNFLKSLSEIFMRARTHRVRFGIKKCSFVTNASEIKILGCIFQEGKKIDPERITAIQKLPIPTTIGELRSFCGSVNYLREWLPNLSHLLQPITALTKKNTAGKPSIAKKWSSLHTKIFIKIKELISNSVELELPDDTHQIIVSTDASEKAVSGVIWKKLDDSDPHSPLEDQLLAPIAFFSKTLSDSQANWPIIQKELFAIVSTLNQPNLTSYLLSKRIILFCDHKNLVFLFDHPEKNRIVTRWIPLLANFDLELVHVEGARNSCADLLSRSFPSGAEKNSLGNSNESQYKQPDKSTVVPPTSPDSLISSKTFSLLATPTQHQETHLLRNDLHDCFEEQHHSDFNNELLEKIRTAQQIDLREDPNPADWNQDLNLFTYNSKILIPKRLRKEWLLNLHGYAHAGHPTFKEALQSLKNSHFYWPNAESDLRTHISECHSCQKNISCPNNPCPSLRQII
ncbi:hypothetical protein GEMRC1_009560 [Eukaryota sp. GEM-RC1]